MKTVTACKCLISPEYVKTLLESAKFHEILVLKAPISCEIPWLKVPNFRWISVIGSTHFHMRIWISLIGSVRFHMNIWNSLIGSAKFHMNFHVWKHQISYEFPCFEIPDFIWAFEIAWLERLKTGDRLNPPLDRVNPPLDRANPPLRIVDSSHLAFQHIEFHMNKWKPSLLATA